jgi:hypothetical protein
MTPLGLRLGRGNTSVEEARGVSQETFAEGEGPPDDDERRDRAGLSNISVDIAERIASALEMRKLFKNKIRSKHPKP